MLPVWDVACAGRCQKGMRLVWDAAGGESCGFGVLLVWDAAGAGTLLMGDAVSVGCCRWGCC